MPDDTMLRAIGGLYIALHGAMPSGAAVAANRMLMAFAESDGTPPDEARIYRALAECAEAEEIAA